jgi:hypothetical protein
VWNVPKHVHKKIFFIWLIRYTENYVSMIKRFYLVSLARLDCRAMVRFDLSNPENFHKILQIYVPWNKILNSWLKKQGDPFPSSELLQDRIGLSYHKIVSINTKDGCSSRNPGKRKSYSTWVINKKFWEELTAYFSFAVI